MSTGDFVWYELMTGDPEAAISFYREVVGWTTQDFAGGPMKYTMWVGSQGPLGGTLAIPEELTKSGVPPHWMAHVQVANVDASVAQVKERGGKVLNGPEDVPTVGRFAVIADPQGATISLFTPASEMSPHDNTKAGEFAWHELYAVDAEKALEFYGAVFGWSLIDAMDMGPMGKYRVFGHHGRRLGGMMNKPPHIPVAMWNYYVHVDDIDAAVAKAKARGANVVNGPMDTPGGSRVAQMFDPQGAFVALHASRAK
jgi:predicted enzyme related to lactoylglutathione lyase